MDAVLFLSFIATVSSGIIPNDYEMTIENSISNVDASQELPACDGNLSQGERNLVLGIHNSARSTISKGEFKDGKDRFMPPASNMLKLLWDCKLERSAQEWAEQCSFRHSNTSGVGENLYMVVSSIPLDRKGLAVNATLAWLEEFDKYGWSNIVLTEQLFYTGIGHATQMVWATTQLIGCASAECNGGKEVIVACHYKESGNILDTDIYEFGESCSECPSGTACEKETMLCSPIS